MTLEQMGGGDVNLKSFSAAADALQLFSDSLQVPPYVGTAKFSQLSRPQRLSLSSLIRRRSKLFELDLKPWLESLPDQHRDRIAYMKLGVEAELTDDGDGVEGTGLRPLVAYRRYLDALITVRMWNREMTGEMPGDFAIMQIDK